MITLTSPAFSFIFGKRSYYYCEISYEVETKKDGMVEKTTRTRTYKRRKFNKQKCARKLEKMIAKNLPLHTAAFAVATAGEVVAAAIGNSKTSSTLRRSKNSSASIMQKVARQKAAKLIQINFDKLKLCKMKKRDSKCEYID
jgi:hypothetical protein